MAEQVMDFIEGYDKEIGEAIKVERGRQRRNLELTASENTVSEPVMAAMGTVLANKYAEGYAGKRYYGGCEFMDVAETIAIERAKKLSGCDYVDVQPHSGIQASMAVFVAMLKPGDTVMGVDLDHGDHLTHGSPVDFLGLYSNIVLYGVNEEGYIDYDKPGETTVTSKSKLTIVGASVYCRTVDFKRFREVADKTGAYLMVDMAHIAGLVVAGLHPSPIPYVDVVTTTTRKILRGLRGGMILVNQATADKFNLNKAISPGIQGGSLEHVIIAKVICFDEALKPESKAHQEQVVKNAAALAAALKKQGFSILTGGTDNHLMLVDLRGMDVSGKEFQNRRDQVYTTLNKNTVSNDSRSPFVTSGVRVGTSAVTPRGLEEEDTEKIAQCTWLVATDFEARTDCIRGEVDKICGKCPLYQQTGSIKYGEKGTENMELETPLHDMYVRYKGKIVSFVSYLLPVRYEKGVIAEYMVVREQCGLLGASHMDEILLSGLDALKNVNMLSTSDYTVMEDGTARCSPMHNEVEGVVDDLIVHKIKDNSYFIVVNASNKDKDY